MSISIPSYDYVFKIIIIGDSGVVKTSLLNRICNNSIIEENTPTIGVEFQSKIEMIDNGERVKCQMWDTAGQENFAPIIKTYYRGSAGAIICFDTTAENPIERINYWYDEIHKNTSTSPQIIVVGTKIDEEPKCDLDEISEFLESKNIQLVLTSARIGLRHQIVLLSLCNKIFDNVIDNKQYNPNDKMSYTGIKFMDDNKIKRKYCEINRNNTEMVKLTCNDKCTIS